MIFPGRRCGSLWTTTPAPQALDLPQGKGNNHHPAEDKPQLILGFSSSLSSSYKGPHPLPRWQPPSCQGRSSGSHQAPALSPQSPALTPTKSTAASVPQEKAQPISLQIQLSHQSHWAHTDCIETIPHKGMPLRPAQVTVLPSFIEMEKVKQNEKAKEYVPKKGTK